MRFETQKLKEALGGIFERRYAHHSEFRMGEPTFDTCDLVVDDKFGTVLVGLCFVTFKVPELSIE